MSIQSSPVPLALDNSLLVSPHEHYLGVVYNPWNINQSSALVVDLGVSGYPHAVHPPDSEILGLPELDSNLSSWIRRTRRGLALNNCSRSSG